MILMMLLTQGLTILFGITQKHPFKQVFLLSIFNFYLIIVLNGVVGFPSFSQTVKDGFDVFNPNLAFVPFAEGIGLSDRLNVLLFVPFGFLLGTLWQKGNIVSVLIAGFSFSLIIEISQLFTAYRITDITDLITNTLGAFLGFVCFKLLRVGNKLQILPSASLYGFLFAIMLLSYLCA